MTRKLSTALLALLLPVGLALAEPASDPADLRVQIQEITYELRPDGSARPIDHRIVDVFDVRFEKQYDSVDRSDDVLDFGLVYFEVPRPEQDPNYNVYLYMRDSSHEVVADGYLNNDVPGALFKLTTMLLERAGDRAYARMTHCVVPRPPGAAGEQAEALEAWRLRQRLHEYVQASLARD